MPADDVPVAGESSAGDGGVGFLDDLGPTRQARPEAPAAQPRPLPWRSPAVGNVARGGRAKKRTAQPKMIYIGGGIVAAVLIVIVTAFALNGCGGDEKTKEVEDIRFGLPEGTRIELFQKLVSAVDRYGITKNCKDDWYRLADEYKLDRRPYQGPAGRRLQFQE